MTSIHERRLLHVVRAKHHAAADMLIGGTYADYDSGTFRACSVGCFAHDIDPLRFDSHAVVAEAIDVPIWLVRWQDTVFEGLPAQDRATFHVGLAEHIAALPDDHDFQELLHRISVARMDRLIAEQSAVVPQEPYHANVIAALRQVRAYHEHPTEQARSVAYSAAQAAAAWSGESESAARSAARSAAEAAWSAEAAEAEAAWSAEAAEAAWSAEAWSAWSARSAAWSAWSAARAAEWSAAEAARSVAYSAARSARSAAWSAWSAAESAAESAESAAESARSVAWSACQNERDAMFAAVSA